MLTLYQFPNSHYCEKVRWALDYKQLDYRIINLLPGLHVDRTAKKLAGSSSLPILVHDGKALQNSSDILTYLERSVPAQCADAGTGKLATGSAGLGKNLPMKKSAFRSGWFFIIPCLSIRPCWSPCLPATARGTAH